MTGNNDVDADRPEALEDSEGGASYGSHGDQQSDTDQAADSEHDRRRAAESGVQADTGIGQPAERDGGTDNSAN